MDDLDNCFWACPFLVRVTCLFIHIVYYLALLAFTDVILHMGGDIILVGKSYFTKTLE
jgi:hypothetical protein